MNIVFSVVATAIGVVAFLYYFGGLFALQTKPHTYTWLIWALTQGIGFAGIWYGNGGWGALSLVIGEVLTTSVFLLSLKYGTKNITKGDTIILIAALIAIALWWQLHQPVLAVALVSVIDVAGYIPTYRKSFADPWSENLIPWFAFSLSNLCAALALTNWNFLTITYLASITSANIILIAICLLRRQGKSRTPGR